MIREAAIDYFLANGPLAAMITNRIAESAEPTWELPYVLVRQTFNQLETHLRGSAGIAHSLLLFRCFAADWSNVTALAALVHAVITDNGFRGDWGATEILSAKFDEEQDLTGFNQDRGICQINKTLNLWYRTE